MLSWRPMLMPSSSAALPARCVAQMPPLKSKGLHPVQCLHLYNKDRWSRKEHRIWIGSKVFGGDLALMVYMTRKVFQD